VSLCSLGVEIGMSSYTIYTITIMAMHLVSHSPYVTCQLTSLSHSVTVTCNSMCDMTMI